MYDRIGLYLSNGYPTFPQTYDTTPTITVGFCTPIKASAVRPYREIHTAVIKRFLQVMDALYQLLDRLCVWLLSHCLTTACGRLI